MSRELIKLMGLVVGSIAGPAVESFLSGGSSKRRRRNDDDDYEDNSYEDRRPSVKQRRSEYLKRFKANMWEHSKTRVYYEYDDNGDMKWYWDSHKLNNLNGKIERIERKLEANEAKILKIEAALDKRVMEALT